MGRTESVATPFGTWLKGELDARSWGVRTLAKRMSPQQPEVARRALNRYIHEGSLPNDASRAAIARGLGIAESDLPTTTRSSSDDEDEEADPVGALLRALRLVVRGEIDARVPLTAEPAASLAKATAGSNRKGA